MGSDLPLSSRTRDERPPRRAEIVRRPRRLRTRKPAVDAGVGGARIRALAAVSHAFSEAVPDYEQLLRVVAERVAEATGDACTVRLLSEDGGWLNPVAGHHPDPALREAIW